MNGLVLYRSRYGATKQYADWIGAELRLPVIDPERVDEQLLTTCDFLLIGTSVYLGELLLKIRRDMFVRGYLLSLSLVAHGDANWKLPASGGQ